MTREDKKRLWQAIQKGIIALVSAILGALTQSCCHII